ncbi:polyketide synthase [Marinivivus vitaminiproducens]|uniref:polyketide synthase n=1 Tax=Marinivivus vitaminiproducens TaxID=3035935 RepID=UPI0027A7BD4A|nr:polyketide synthase [Geminicoccaceae bacterium SCSIO 64248]
MADVVRLSRHNTAVAVIEMADREGRNTFTHALVEGLGHALRRVADDASVKVVVIHGYESIFCAGGTQEELLTLAEHKVTFDAHDFYRCLLDCSVPVIAAMQGHALGGGLVFGLYADLVVLSQESLFAANFMKYGITPGMGATLLLPMKLGVPLAGEMLFSARGYHGGTLRDRGIGMPVVPRADTVATALKLADDLADKSGVALRLLKQAMNHRLLRDLPDVIAREKAMHETSFAQPDVIGRITERFGR